jgi:hypothetical protein
MNKLAQFNTANAIKDAAKNEGLGGAGIGMGVGMGMGNMMSNMFNQTGMNQQNNSVPPPPPTIQFHVVIGGAQAGPFNLQQLQAMATSGQLTKSTLVWKAGMANWASAESQPELAAIFTSVPPPPPPVG